jgi:isopentenyldiphosphate isomerase
MWTNTVCSHQRPGETNEQAVRRQIKHELGVTLKKETELKDAAKMIYAAESGGGWGEHERKKMINNPSAYRMTRVDEIVAFIQINILV